MKFKSLNQQDKEFIKKTYLDKELSFTDRLNAISQYTGKSTRTVQMWISKLGLTEKTIEESPEFKKAQQRQFNKRTKKFIISWAQNNTPIHERFLKNMEAYANNINADIHIIAGRYKNPTSIFTDRDHDRWDPRITKYLDAARHDVHKYCSIMSDVKIQPTAVNPMTGMQGMSGINSCIFGSPKVQMEMIPVLNGCKPKMMLTTGACTVMNYTDSKSGKKGEFHHILGFAIIEIKDDHTFFVRQVMADKNGDFIDLYNEAKFEGEYLPIKFEDALEKVRWISNHFGAEPNEWVGETTISEVTEIEACVLGDIHYGHEDHEVMSQTFKLLNKLVPKHVVLHDVFDGSSISHHDAKDPFAQYRKEVKNTNSLKNEIDYMLDQLRHFENFENVVIVRSNHDDFLDRWLKNEDWKKQSTAKNSMEYMEYSQILLKQYSEAEELMDIKGVIPELINRQYPKFKTLTASDSYIVKGWELSQHGNVGSNGSRGSLNQFRNLNTKVITGHYHSPGRKDGSVSVGTSTKLRIDYNLGASSWLQSHVIIHKNGKVQHINFIDGEFTTM